VNSPCTLPRARSRASARLRRGSGTGVVLAAVVSAELSAVP